MGEDHEPPEDAAGDERHPEDDVISRRLDRLFEVLRQPLLAVSPAAQFLAEHPQFGRYQLIRPLGEGAMGLVFLARDTKLDREVALKLPKLETSDPNRLARFEREGKAAAKLRHPNICTVYDVGEIDGHQFMTMAFIEGRPLSDLIATNKSSSLPKTPFSASEAARLVATLAAVPWVVRFGMSENTFSSEFTPRPTDVYSSPPATLVVVVPSDHISQNEAKEPKKPTDYALIIKTIIFYALICVLGTAWLVRWLNVRRW